jgi:hypothetical protein
MIVGMTSHPEKAWSRADLYARAEAYLDALVAKDPSRLSFAPQVVFTENNVQLMLGDGLWNTITARRADYDLKCADLRDGQVSWFGVIEERGQPAIMALRLAFDGDAISEVETIVCRAHELGPFPEISGYEKPVRPLLGQIAEVEAVFVTVPYNMVSPWIRTSSGSATSTFWHQGLQCRISAADRLSRQRRQRDHVPCRRHHRRLAAEEEVLLAGQPQRHRLAHHEARQARHAGRLYPRQP